MSRESREKLSARNRDKAEKRFKVENLRATLKRLLGYFKGYRLAMLFAMAMVLLRALGNVGGNGLLKPIINGLVENRGVEFLIRYLLLMAAIYLSTVLATWLGERFFSYAAENVKRKIRADLFRHSMGLPLSFFDAHSHGELMSHYTNDIDNVNSMLEESMGNLATAVVSFVATLVMMLFMSPVLTLLVFVMLLLMLLLLRWITGRSSGYFRRRQASLGDLNGFIEEMMSGQKVVQVFNHEEAALDDFSRRNEHLRKSSSMANTYATMLFPLLGNFSFILFAVVAMVGSLMTIRGSYGMDVGTLAAFLQFTRSIANPLVNISQQFNLIIAAVAGAERIFRVMDEKAEVDLGLIETAEAEGRCYWRLPPQQWQSPQWKGSGRALFSEAERLLPARQRLECLMKRFPGAKAARSDEETVLWDSLPEGLSNIEECSLLIPLRGDLRIAEVVFAYNEDKTVLDGISLYAKPGQKIAFVGSTGAGKTTVTNLINRFYEIRSGNIEIDGIDIRDIAKAALRQQLGMVLQDVRLFRGSIFDNIRYGRLDATDEELMAAARLANAENFILQLPQGYMTELADDGSNLSQGQRQLLSIARAAIHDPLILILDEATSSIDTRTERYIEKGMDGLMEGRSTLVIAHRLSTVRHSDAILILEEGKIEERGDHEQLLQLRGRYYELSTGAAELG